MRVLRCWGRRVEMRCRWGGEGWGWLIMRRGPHRATGVAGRGRRRRCRRVASSHDARRSVVAPSLPGHPRVSADRLHRLWQRVYHDGGRCLCALAARAACGDRGVRRHLAGWLRSPIGRGEPSSPRPRWVMVACGVVSIAFDPTSALFGIGRILHGAGSAVLLLGWGVYTCSHPAAPSGRLRLRRLCPLWGGDRSPQRRSVGCDAVACGSCAARVRRPAPRMHQDGARPAFSRRSWRTHRRRGVWLSLSQGRAGAFPSPSCGCSLPAASYAR